MLGALRTGELAVEYHLGHDLRKDLLYPQGMDPRHCVWWETPPGNGGLSPGWRPRSSFAFGGSTRGFFLFPFPFQDQLEVEYALELGMMRTGGAVRTVLLSSPDGRDCVCANFAAVEVWRRGELIETQPPLLAEYDRSPSYWFPRSTEVALRVRYDAGAGATPGQVQVWLGGGGGSVLINSRPVTSSSGLAGFSWSDVKFNVRWIKVRGRLDRKAAVRFLRARAEAGG